MDKRFCLHRFLAGALVNSPLNNCDPDKKCEECPLYYDPSKAEEERKNIWNEPGVAYAPVEIEESENKDVS